MKSKMLRTCTLSIAVLAALGCASSALAGGRPDLVLAALDAGHAQHRPNELLVQFRTTNPAGQRAIVQGLRASHLKTVRAGAAPLQLLRLPAGTSVAAAVRALRNDPAVDFAEPNWIYQHTAVSNDTYYTNGSLYGMYGDATSPANQYGSQAGEAWAAGHTCNSSIFVGVIDEGIMDGHEDLSGNVWTNPNDPADGLDNDNNGFVDDIHGWDFDGNDNSTFDGVQDDHGTHVSGTIAGVGGNGKGVAGVCWSAKLISGKFLGRGGGSTSDAVLALDYMLALKQSKGLNIVATNNSWGGGGFSQSLQDAIERNNAGNILFIAAAGNSGADNDATASYPSNYPNGNVIAVAAIDKNGALASWSQYGALTVDLGAPGVAVVSTVPKRVKGSMVSAYASYSGTSMATPHVAGAAALYASTHPGATAAQIKAAILSSTIFTSSLDGKTVTEGRLNVSGF